jgi:catechol 2,3-dioxygenase-like lactoylglutathione lyase family enzyme
MTTLVVRDDDEAIDFYTRVMRFAVVEAIEPKAAT